MVDFLCIGAQKSGTTWLYRHLMVHPQIKMPCKELHHWNQDHWWQTDKWLKHFPDREDGVIQGELTPNYCVIDHSRIELLARTCPDVKLFASLRNPVDRTWSAARMFCKDGDYLNWLKTTDGLVMSDYEPWLRRWFRRFSSRQLFVFPFERITESPRSLLYEIARHIGVDPCGFDAIDHESLHKPKHVGLDVPMSPDVERFLRDHFRPKMKSLRPYLRALGVATAWDV